MFDISVNLATRNRAEFLKLCLESLCQQNVDPERFEICVVANACTDSTPTVVEGIAARYPRHHVFMVEEPIPGLSRARNRGLKATHAPLVAHIDDDGTVYPNWLELFLKHFAEFGSDLAIVTGEIEPVWSTPRPVWLTDDMLWPLSAKTALGPEARFLRDDDWLMEGNSCYRRSVLEKVGGYPEHMGRIGDCLLSGEGSIEEIILKSGHRAYFDPKIVLRHYIHADRLTPAWFRHRFFWQGVSNFATWNYKRKNNLPVNAQFNINLPLDPGDWAFVNRDSSEGIHENLRRFTSLGFVLALSGILPTENS